MPPSTTDRTPRWRYRRASTRAATIAAVALFAVFAGTSAAGAATASSSHTYATPNIACC